MNVNDNNADVELKKYKCFWQAKKEFIIILLFIYETK